MRKTLFFAVAFLSLLAVLEVCSFIATGFLEKKGAIYRVPSASRQEYAEYLSTRDAHLGWLLPQQSEAFRPSPAYPEAGKYPSCASVYGDSFTYGSGVSDEEVYSNVLSNTMRCRVANYGVGGYGTDQAYLRFQKNTSDNSPIVILGYSPENILRNVNRYRALLYAQDKGARFAFKPVFTVAGDGQLQLLPLPELSYADFLRVVSSPEKYLKGEYFLPGGEAGIVKRQFPFTLTLIKVLTGNFHARAKIAGIPWYAPFYAEGHPANGLNVTFGIIERFSAEAKARGRTPVVLIIPTGLDLEYYRKTGQWTYARLVDLLKKNQIRFIDAGPQMLDYLKERDPCELYFGCSGHLNAEGEKELAIIVYTYLKKNAIAH